MKIASGRVSIDLDIQRLNGTVADNSNEVRLDHLRFDIGSDSFFTIRVINQQLRGPEQGSIVLIPDVPKMLPEPLNASSRQLVLEKIRSGTSTPALAAQALNLSTRLRVSTGNNVGIGGFIITGGQVQLLLRAIGPSLSSAGIFNSLADPVLELHGSKGFLTVTNDNWRDTQEAEIQATGIPPTNVLESAILATLDPGSYTAVMSGNQGGTGVGLAEIYTLSQDAGSKLANISTRAFVGTGNDIVIAGFILGGGSEDDPVILRGLGPSVGVSPPLVDPRLELRDSSGVLIASNENWQDDPAQAVIVTSFGLAPSNPMEAAIAISLPPGGYTGLLIGTNNGTGVGVIEIYDNPPGGPPSTPSPTPEGSATPTATPGGSVTPTPTLPPLDANTDTWQYHVRRKLRCSDRTGFAIRMDCIQPCPRRWSDVDHGDCNSRYASQFGVYPRTGWNQRQGAR